MTPRQWRWFVMALLLGLGGTAACWVWLLDAAQPPHQPPKVLAAPRWPASQAVAAASAQSRVAVAPVAASAPTSKPSAPELRIGSEGYGVHIELALESGDPARAWQAVRWILDCAGLPHLQASLQTPDPDASAALMDRFKADVRQLEVPCQTVTARQSALLLPLTLAAANGQVRSAASLAAHRKFWRDLDQTTQDRLRGFIVRDLHVGDLTTALAATTSGDLWGLGGEDWMMVCMVTMQRDVDVPTCARRFSGNEHLVLPEVGSTPWVAARAIVKKAGLDVEEQTSEK